MPQKHLTAWLRPLFMLLAIAGALSLAGCGGGSGAPNNPYEVPDVPPVPPTLVVLPDAMTIYSGMPANLTITSGTAPFFAFSSNSTVLPLPAQVPANVALLASSVAADESVTVTIRDATGQTATSLITVKPSLLLPASITITGNPVCGGSGAQLCSGQDGTATVKLTGAAGAPLAGRPVRFDVILGTFSLIAANATTPAQSVTVQSDQNGDAVVTIRVPVNAVTQFATLRATDVTTGSNVLAQFTIAQYVNGNSVLSVIPTGTTTFTGPNTEQCASSGIASFYVFGGTPPYTVRTNFPTAVTIMGSPVLTSGGAFSVTPSGTCFTGLTFAITDASGRTLLTPPTVDNVLGTAEPPPPDLVVSPSRIPSSGTVACTANAQIGQIVASGGTGTYAAGASGGTGGPLIANATEGQAGQITISVGPTNASGTWTVTVSSGSQIRQVTVACS